MNAKNEALQGTGRTQESALVQKARPLQSLAQSNMMYDDDYNRKKILDALERSPESGWLPSDPDARSAVARDLAQMLGERIRAMRD